MLKDTLLKFLNVDGLIKNLTGYIETRLELFKVEIKEDIAKALSTVFLALIVLFAVTLIIFFISMAVALKLADYLGDFGGFACVAGFYVLLVAILLVFHKNVTGAIENKLKEIMKLKK